MPKFKRRPLMRSDDRAGMLLAAMGFATLSLSDAVVKSIVPSWSPVGIAALRQLLGAAMLAALLAGREGLEMFSVPCLRFHLLRGGGMAVASGCFFAAVKFLPLATTTAIFFASPLMTAALSSIILREKNEARTWGAMFAAFAGVLIVLRPNLVEAGLPALLPLVGAMGMSITMIGNRLVAGQSSALKAQMLIVIEAFARWCQPRAPPVHAAIARILAP